MSKSKGLPTFFSLMLILAIAVVCAAIVDNIVKYKLIERVDVVKSALIAKRVESSATAKLMLCLNEFENVVKNTKFFEINLIKSQVNTVNHIEMFAKDSYLSRVELLKLQSQNICGISMINQSSRQVASQKDQKKPLKK
ncbi:MAG: hypothetical protein SGJ18_12970 [Pseudomonadota bacterium]|nr:hypothetical protein [Pseudomonadota bacterium]